jgi:DNA-binding transcriptional LysR family regulator
MPQLNERDLRLRDLRLLEVMLTEGSLTRAATRLNTTQPSLSKALARLRTHFEDPLLVRDGQIMRPTPKGTGMLTPIRELLGAAKGIGNAGNGRFDPASSSRKFRLIVSDVGMVLFLPALTARLAASGAGLKLEAIPLDSHNFEARLASGEADLALGAYAKAPQDLRRQLLYADSYLSVVRRDHPRKRHLGRIADFRVAQHIVVTASETGHTAHRMAQDVIEGTVAADHVLLRLPSFIAAALVAAETDGVATLPANLAMSIKDRLQLATFQPSVKMPPIAVTQYWHGRYHQDPGHRWLRQTCFGLFGHST